MVHNRALIAYSINDIPAALSYFAEAAARYEPLHVLVPDLTIDRCAVLLAAGLAGDALAEADGTVREIERFHGQSTKKAELLLVAATCALAAAQPQTALDRAQAANRMYRSQHNIWRLARTRLVLVQAKAAVGPVTAQLLRGANRAAARLEEIGSGDAVQAHLVAGRVALELGRHADADRHFHAAAAAGGAARQCHVRAAGSARRCGRRPPAIRAGCSARATGGWRSWTSIGSPWARRNCGRRPPRTALSWPCSRNARQRGRAGRGSCWPGVSAGAPPRSRSPRCGRWPTRSSRLVSRHCAASCGGWTRHGARTRRAYPRSRNKPGSIGNGNASRAWCAPVHCARVVSRTSAPPSSASLSCSIRWAPLT